MDVVAEGVETVGQMAALQDMGCAFLQGWLFGRPMPLEDIRRLVADFDPAILDGHTPKMDARVHLVGRNG
jgi:EAL domain-containing protein (putative c-di-GMP-specific phosphodiesterase class I)